MKAIRFHEYGDINVLRYEEARHHGPAPGKCSLRSRRRRSTRWTGGSGQEPWMRFAGAISSHVGH